VPHRIGLLRRVLVTDLVTRSAVGTGAVSLASAIPSIAPAARDLSPTSYRE